MGNMSKNMVIGLVLAALGIVVGIVGFTALPEGLVAVGGVAGAICVGVAVLFISRGMKDAKELENKRFTPKDLKGVGGESSAAKPGRAKSGPIELD